MAILHAVCLADNPSNGFARSLPLCFGDATIGAYFCSVDNAFGRNSTAVSVVDFVCRANAHGGVYIFYCPSQCGQQQASVAQISCVQRLPTLAPRLDGQMVCCALRAHQPKEGCKDTGIIQGYLQPFWLTRLLQQSR